MALDVTVGGVDAEGYISAADADIYHNARGNNAGTVDWVNADTDAKEACLRKATSFLDSRYRSMWKGRRADAGQALAWPRRFVRDEDGATVDETTIPRAILHACCEAALAEMFSPGVLFPQVERETKMERVGPIAVEYVAGSTQKTLLTVVLEGISGLLEFPGGNTGWLLRA